MLLGSCLYLISDYTRACIVEHYTILLDVHIVLSVASSLYPNRSGSPDTVVQYGSDQQQSPFSAAQSTGDPQLTMLVNAAGRKTQPPSLTPSSTFESAAAAGAAAAALIEKSPRLRDTSPIVLDSPQYSPQYTPTKHEVEAMAIAAAAAAARAGRVTAAGSPAWDPSTSTRDIAAAAAAVQDAKGNSTGAATVEPWRPSKPSEPWKPTAPWKPPGRAEIPALPVPAVGTVPLRPVSNSSSAGYPAAARPAVGSAAAQKPAAAAATAAAPSAAAVMGIRRDTSESEYPATPRAGSLDVAGEDGDGELLLVCRVYFIGHMKSTLISLSLSNSLSGFEYVTCHRPSCLTQQEPLLSCCIICTHCSILEHCFCHYAYFVLL